MLKRQLQAHELLLLAIYEIERKEDLDHDDVCAYHLRFHPRTTDMTDEQRYRAVKILEDEGWLRRNPRYFAMDDFRGIGLSEDGRAKAVAVNEPRWRPPLLLISRRVETVLLSVVTAVATVLVLKLID